MSLLILNEDELRQTITITEIIETVQASFAALAEGRMNMPDSFSLHLPAADGESQVKGTYLLDAAYYVVRVGNTFQNNLSINLPIQNALIAVFDATTGFPAAIMVDNGYLTLLRAGAAGALTASYLANQELQRVAVIGSGRHAYAQIKALCEVRNINLVSVWGRTPVHVDNYARLIIEDHDLNVEIAPTVEAAVTNADLIITATASRQPLIQAEWLKPGVHIIAAGSNEPTKQELHPNVFSRSTVIIADDVEQCAANGEIHHALAAGVITKDKIRGGLGDLVIGKIEGRTHPDEITVADLTGLDVQESAIATLALEKALFLGLGLQTESSTTNIQTWPIG